MKGYLWFHYRSFRINGQQKQFFTLFNGVNNGGAMGAWFKKRLYRKRRVTTRAFCLALYSGDGDGCLFSKAVFTDGLKTKEKRILLNPGKRTDFKFNAYYFSAPGLPGLFLRQFKDVGCDGELVHGFSGWFVGSDNPAVQALRVYQKIIRGKGCGKQYWLWVSGKMLHGYGFSPLVLFFVLQGKQVWGDVRKEDIPRNTSMQQGDVKNLG